jgi:hypothetical protein
VLPRVEEPVIFKFVAIKSVEMILTAFRLVVVALVNVAPVAVRLVTTAFVATKSVVDAIETTIDVPVALVNVSAARSANELSLSVFAETAPANVDVPDPAATVIAPPNVEVAVPVAIKLPKIVWPYNVVEASVAEVVAANVPNTPFDVTKLVV